MSPADNAPRAAIVTNRLRGLGRQIVPRRAARLGAVRAAVVAVLVLVLGGTATAAVSASGAPARSGGWQDLAPIAAGARQEHGVVAVGRTVYAIGGIRPESGSTVVGTDLVEAFDTRTNRWRTAAPLPIAANHVNTAAVDGKVYVLGALSNGDTWRALGNSYVYEPSTDRWTMLRPMPAGTERGSAAMAVRGSTIYLAGGMRLLEPREGGRHVTVRTVSAYNTRTGRWRRLPALPEARDHVGGSVIDDRLYVVGGRDDGQQNIRGTVFSLDLRRPGARWETRAPMPTPRGGLATATIGGRIYTFGGEGNPAAWSDGVFPHVEVYDARRNLWRSLGQMRVPRHGTGAVAVGGAIYVPGGGVREGGGPVDALDVFRPVPAATSDPRRN